MPIYGKMITSGDVIEYYEYFSLREIGKQGSSRGSNINLTEEWKKDINITNAQKTLCRTINTNFTRDDLFFTFGYREKVTEEFARKELQLFFRRLKYYLKRNDKPKLKYIAVTEAKNTRVHHHVIMNFVDLNIVGKLWTHGGFYNIHLYSEDYAGLAQYITKESIKNDHKKRWSQSRNLDRPKVDVKQLKKFSKELKPKKGYRIIESYSSYNDVTGHVKYMKSVKTTGFDISIRNEVNTE